VGDCPRQEVLSRVLDSLSTFMSLGSRFKTSHSFKHLGGLLKHAKSTILQVHQEINDGLFRGVTQLPKTVLLRYDSTN
jgi:hypothetical protein